VIGRWMILLCVQACLLLAGCAAWQTEKPVTPSSYQKSREQVPRNVGKLRRLAVLPIHQTAPSVCGIGNSEIDISPGIPVPGATEFLTTQRGYELIPLDPERYRQWLDSSSNQAFLKEIAEWSTETSADTPPGPLTESLVEYARTGDNADGLLVFFTHYSCDRANPALRALFGISTAGISEFVPGPIQNVHPTYRVAILEAATKRPVWRVAMPDPWLATRARSPLFDKKMSYPEILFEDLEPAIPKLLTR